MAKNLNLLDQNIVMQLINDVERGEERGRKKHEFRDWQIYSGNVSPYVEAEIARTRPNSHAGYTISDVSFSKMITDTKAKAYKEMPYRNIGNDKTKNEEYSKMLSDAGVKKQMPYLDTITNLHKHSLLWVNYHEFEEKYQLMAMQGYEWSVVRDKDTGELIGVILNYGNRDIVSGSFSGDGYDNLIAESQADSSAQSKIYVMWSKENYVIIEVESVNVTDTNGQVVAKRSITYVENPENPNNENKLGVIPFIYTSQECAIDFPTPSPLGDQTTKANALMSEYLTASNIQGTGQLVIKYPKKLEGMFKKLTMGLLSAIKLPQSSNPEDRPTEVDYINPNPDLAGQKDAVLTYVKQVMNEHGLKNTSSVDDNSASFSSGLHMAIANASVQDIIEENQLMYVEVEKQMFEIFKAWESFLGNSVFSEDDEIQVVFKKPKVLISDKEVLENIDKRLSLGLIEKYEALMLLDPNMSEDDAIEKASKIKDSQMSAVKNINFNNGNDEDEENM